MIPQECTEEYEPWVDWMAGAWGYTLDSFLFRDGHGLSGQGYSGNVDGSGWSREVPPHLAEGPI